MVSEKTLHRSLLEAASRSPPPQCLVPPRRAGNMCPEDPSLREYRSATLRNAVYATKSPVTLSLPSPREGESQQAQPQLWMSQPLRAVSNHFLVHFLVHFLAQFLSRIQA